MEKYLKIFLYVIALVAVYFAFTMLLKSCNAKKENAHTLTDNESIENAEDLFEDSDDESFEANTSAQDEISYDEIDEALIQNENKETEEDKEISVQPTTPSEPKDSYVSDNSDDDFEPQKPVEKASRSGNFLVITGSYLVRSNAENMVRKLNNLGYNNAEIVVFDNSQYNSVVADRHNNYQSAVDASSNLKRRGIDSYVHSKK